MGTWLMQLVFVLYCTIHQLIFSPCVKLVNKSNPALTSIDWGLQNSSNFSHMTSKVSSSLVKIHWHILVYPKMPTPGNNFLVFPSSLQALQAHISVCFHSFISISNIFGTDNHWPVHSIFGPSIIRHKHAWNNLLCMSLIKSDFLVIFFFWPWLFMKFSLHLDLGLFSILQRRKFCLT